MRTNPWQVESVEAFLVFWCPECPFLSKEKEYFEDHALKNHPLSFELFEKEFEIEDGMTINRRIKIPLIKTEECESEITIEGNPQLSNATENDYYSDNPKDVASSEFEVPDPLTIHEIVNQERGRFKDISETSRSKVWAHFLLNRNEMKARCVHCSKILKAKGGNTKSLHDHLKLKHSTVVPKLNKNVLSRKMASVHEGKKSETTHICELCGKSYVDPRDLNLHIASIHDGNKPYMCEICGSSFADKRYIQKHVKLVHEKKPKQSYKYSKCDGVFLGSKKLARHVKLKHGKKDFKDISENSKNQMDESKDEFKDISESSKSKVWAHFLLNRNEWKARCLHCSQILKAKGGSTKGLRDHVKLKHSIIVPKLNNLNFTKENELKSTFNDDLTTLPFQNGISLSVPKW